MDQEAQTRDKSVEKYEQVAALVEGCLKSDGEEREKMWDRLTKTYEGLVYSIAFEYNLSKPEADDVFQIVSEQIFRRLGTLRKPGSFISWVGTIARRQAQRSSQKIPQDEELDELIEDDNGGPPDLENDERRRFVAVAIERLDPLCRELLGRLFFTSSEYSEIAAELGMSVGSVGPTRRRCFAKLEQIIESMGVVTGVSPSSISEALPSRKNGMAISIPENG